jgi:hypothetical protein
VKDFQRNGRIHSCQTQVFSINFDESQFQSGCFSGQAFVGLTSGTGRAAENHDILDWSFVTPEPSGLAALALGGVILVRRHRRPSKV